MNKIEEIKKIIEKNSSYSNLLFKRAYLITTKELNLSFFPFYNKWRKYNFHKVNNNKNLYIYNQQDSDFNFLNSKDFYIAIIGHSYNPYNMKYIENEILEELKYFYQKEGLNKFFDYVSELTGIHLIILNDNGKLIVVQDCAGIKSCYFGKIGEDIFITSHPQLVADLLDLKIDPFVEELTKTKFYSLTNQYLPGNISPYKELKRLGPNTYLSYENEFKIIRFYPTKPLEKIYKKEDYNKNISRIYELLHNNLILISKKWKNPAISLSGGNDSKTTLACANGLYDKFKYFSFYCKKQEYIDAMAAKKICDNLNLSHIIYEIPKENKEFENFDLLKKIIYHNSSYFKLTKDHELRKLLYLIRLKDFDVEVKSWSSEITRVFFERKYFIKTNKYLNERKLSIFQSRYFLANELLSRSDKINLMFQKEVQLDKEIFNYDYGDLIYWELRMGAWGSSVNTELEIAHKITFPFNSRKIIELFLEFPKDLRREDKIHKTLIKKTNKKIYDSHIEIRNLYFHSYRIYLEKIFFLFMTKFYKSKR